MTTNSNEPKDGAALRERAVAEGDALRAAAVDHARKAGGAVNLADAPESPDAPPPYPAPPVPAPPVPAPPYPRRTLKETLPATPRALARQTAEAPAAVAPTPPPEPAPSTTETATNEPDDKPSR